jgi:nucleotide-binding universal stress UspA family protein
MEPTVLVGRRSVGWAPDLDDHVQTAARRLVDVTVDVLSVQYPHLEIDISLETGSAAQVLIEESHRVDTVVVGSRGAGGFSDLVVGSTAQHVAAHGACAVVAVPDLFEQSDEDSPRRGVVVGVDGSDASEAAIGYAFGEASDTGERLTAVHVWHEPGYPGVGRMMLPPGDPEELAQEELLVLAESMAGWTEKFPEVEVVRQVVIGHPVETLVMLGARARVLVVGSRGRGSVRSALMGSVSHGVLHHAKGPVAVVHGSI